MTEQAAPFFDDEASEAPEPDPAYDLPIGTLIQKRTSMEELRTAAHALEDEVSQKPRPAYMANVDVPVARGQLREIIEGVAEAIEQVDQAIEDLKAKAQRY